MFGALNWAPWQFLLEQPWWLGGLLFIAITPLGLWLWRGLIQNIWVNPFTHDWMSSNADIVLGVGFAAELWLASRSDNTLPQWGSQFVIASLAVIFVGHFLVDIRQVGLKRQLGATSLYHLLTGMVVGPPFVYLLWATRPRSWGWDTVVYCVPLLALLVWLAAVVYDIRHPNAPDGKSKFDYTTPKDGWRNIRLLWRWLMKRSDLGFGRLYLDQLMQTLPVVSVIIRRRPLQAFLVTVFFTHGMLIILNWVVYGMWVPPSYWWVSSFYGDLALAAAISLLLEVASNGPDQRWHRLTRFQRVLRRAAWLVFDLALLAGFYYVAWLHMLQEHESIGSWARHWGATSAYHNMVLYPLLGYTLVRLLLRGLRVVGIRAVALWKDRHHRNWRLKAYWLGDIAMVGLALLLVYGWYLTGQYDGSHPLAPNGQPKFLYSAPPDPWQNIRLLWEWLSAWLQAHVTPLFSGQ